jgi:hypothetical protein
MEPCKFLMLFLRLASVSTYPIVVLNLYILIGKSKYTMKTRIGGAVYKIVRIRKLMAWIGPTLLYSYS